MATSSRGCHRWVGVTLLCGRLLVFLIVGAVVEVGFLAGWLVVTLSSPLLPIEGSFGGESLFSAVGAAGERKVAQVWGPL